jgi:N-acyl-D-amino-acid deacylase
VLDGSGNPWYYADIAISGDRIVAVGDLEPIAISGDRIVAVGDLEPASADRVIDAVGLYVAPGFIRR